MQLILVLILSVACFWSSEAQVGARSYCGRHLSDVMAALCWGSEEVAKRDAGWWLKEDSSRALGGARGKRGLVDECCYKQCTIDELLMYC